MKKVLYILGQLADSDIEWMVREGYKEKIPAGKFLIKEGVAIDSLYILLDGALSVYVSALGDKEVNRLGCGEIVGEISLIDSRPPSASIKASEDAVVLTIPHDALKEKLKEDSEFAARFYRAMAVFLAARLRTAPNRLGFGQQQQLKDDVEYQDEIDQNLLDTVHIAGDRFIRLLARMLNA